MKLGDRSTSPDDTCVSSVMGVGPSMVSNDEEGMVKKTMLATLCTCIHGHSVEMGDENTHASMLPALTASD